MNFLQISLIFNKILIDNMSIFTMIASDRSCNGGKNACATMQDSYVTINIK